MKYTILAALLLPFCGSQFAVPPANAQVDPLVLASALPLTAAPTVPASTRARVLEKYAHLPLRFEANQGQTDQRVRFLSRGSGYTLFLTPTEAVVSVSEPAGGLSDPKRQGFSLTHNRISTLRMELFGAKTDATIAGSEELPGRSNYFIGNDPHQWHTHIPAFARVNYKDIYPGVDLVYYGNQRQLEYDFVVAPGADPNRIRLKISSSHQIRIDQNGDVLIGVGTRDFRLGAPTVYQEYEGKHHSVDGKWIQSKRHELQFGLGAYDHSRALIVDPTLLVYSTYLGGSLTDQATGVAVDSDGDAYITGSTASGGTIATVPFPTTPGAYQPQCNGCTSDTGTDNAFVTELDPTGTILLYSTYLGGSNGDGANGIAIDSAGNAYVVGTTFSGAGVNKIPFPTTPGAFQTACAGGCTSGDAFVTEVAAGGSSLVFSTFLGGTGKDQGNAIAVDSQGGIYVTGFTASTNFPIQNPYQPDCSNSCTFSDAFVTKFNPGGAAPLAYSTYLGGSESDQGNAIAVDSTGDAYVTGTTLSGAGTSATPFPTTTGAFQTACGGCASSMKSGFVTKFNASGSALDYSTFLGGSLYPSGAAGDSAFAIALDTSGDAYVAGAATSTNFPTKNAYQSSCKNSCSGGDAFVTELNSSGTSLNYSTYLGGSGADQANGIALDAVGNAFVTGFTASTDFPIPNQNYAYQPACAGCAGGGHDAFVAEFDVAGSALVFSSYLGGKTTQAGSGIAINFSNGGDQAVLAGSTESIDFPVFLSGQSTFGGATFGGVEDAFIAQFVEAASCTTTHTQTGMTLTATITCFGNFANGNQNQFMGFNWGDPNNSFTGSGNGGGNNCGVTPGMCTFSAPFTYASSSNPTFSVTTTVNDASSNGTSGNNIITTGFSVTIPSTLAITPISLPNGSVGTAYTPTTLKATGGTAPYAWSIVPGSGTLPAGLLLNATTGVISGTPTAAGKSNFTVQVEDAEPATATLALSITITNPLTITTQPASQTINSGQTATMTVVASGGTGTLTYQWYQGTSGVTTNPISAATKSSYTTPTLTATTSYWVQVKDGASDTANSNTAIITVNAPGLTITTQPASQTINSGQTATMTVVASGGTGTLTYQWYQGTSGVTTNPISAATKSSYTTPTLTATTSYWVQVKDGASDTANSNTAIITVNAPGLTITTQPASQTINSGQTATMTVVASGGTGTLTYQWYQGTSGVTTNPISAATKSSYTTPTLTATTSYWVQVKDGASDTANSNTAIITVNAPGLTITTQPASQTINSGQTATMTVVASGGTGTLTYQWYQGTSGVTTSPVGGATQSSYTTLALTATTSYWVQVKDGGSDTANSNTATITVVQPPTITTQPASQTINSGQTATMTVAASGGSGTLTYQWYLGSSGTTTSPISGATHTSYTTPVLTATATYWVQVKDGAGNSASSNTATITVVAPPTCAAPTVQTSTNSLSVTASSNCTDSGSTISSTSIDWGDDSAASSGTSGSHTYAASGTFTITVTATNANNLTSSASATITVTAPLTTPVQQGQAATQTANVVAPPGGDITVTYACTSADGPNGTQPLSTYFLSSCTVLGPNNSSTVNLTSTPQAVTVSVNTTGPTASQSAARSGRVGGLYSAFLFLPGIALLGVGCSRRGRGKVGRYASLALLGLMMMGWLACGGGTIAPPPPQNVTPPGTYGINITGTSSTGTTVTVTVGFTVTIG